MSQHAEPVTFLFTDIEGSTRLWEERPDAMRVALARHDALLRQIIEECGGRVFKTMGDAVCAAFTDPADAARAAIAGQRALGSERWPDGIDIRVRMALHSGAAEIRQGDYLGPPLNRLARLLAIAHGGQVLVSEVTRALLGDLLPTDSTLRSLGEHRLKDLGLPMAVFQLCHRELPVDFPPLRSLGNANLKHNLPHQLTTFIGREAELAEVRQLFDTTRLVTLTGAGGMGKSRLALQVAAEILDGMADGVWLVELAALTDPSLVPQAVARALGVREQPGRSIMQTLLEHLSSKRLLLILDNCEHVLDKCAEVANAVLRSSSEVLILTTSREVLSISGETVYRVPALSLPNPRRDSTPEALSGFEAARLFLDRATQGQPDFMVTDKNARTIASICHRLEGIPLAVELAAARVRSLSVEDVNRKLDQRFRLLTGGSRTAQPRQQTLRALIDWSYDLLNDKEQALLCRLSVFRGGCTLESVEQVCSGEGIEAGEVLDLLASLADKSMLTADPRGDGTRYRLLETVRQYANDRLLERDEGERWRERHFAWTLTLARDAEPHLAGTEQQAWLERLDEERDNLRAALRWAEGFKAEAALQAAGSIWRFWYVRGHFAEGRGILSRLLAAGDSGMVSPARASALTGAGVLAYCQSEYTAARDLFEEALAIRRNLGDRPGVAAVLNNLGNVAYDQGHYAAARDLFEESLSLRREFGETRGVAATLNNLGNVANEQGDYDTARRLFEESVALKEQLGDRWGVAQSLSNLGMVAYNQGNHSGARALFDESLTIRREVGDRAGCAISLNNLGNAAIAQGDYDAARALFRESLEIERELGDRWGMAFSLEGLAAVAAALGTPERAGYLWGAAESLREEISAPLPQGERAGYEAQVASARASMGDDTAFDAAWQEGRESGVERAITAALAERDS